MKRITALITLLVLPSTALADESCDTGLVPAELATAGAQDCSLAGWMAAYPSEDQHVYALRLPVNGDHKFLLDSITYGLVGAGIGGCDGGVEHRVDVWVQESEFPDADPTLAYSTTVQHVVDPTAPNAFHTIDVPNLLLDPDDSLYVGFAMVNSGGDLLCVQTCYSGGSVPAPAGVHFWSNAAATPYPWADMTDFGITGAPVLEASGSWVGVGRHECLADAE